MVLTETKVLCATVFIFFIYFFGMQAEAEKCIFVIKRENLKRVYLSTAVCIMGPLAMNDDCNDPFHFSSMFSSWINYKN